MTATDLEKTASSSPLEEMVEETLSRAPEADPTPKENPPAALQEEVERLSAEVEKWRDQALRLAADFDNYRRRVQRDLPQQLLSAQSEILRALLPIIDSMERGLLSAEKAPDLDRLKEGLRLTIQQMHKALERLEIGTIRPSVGELPDLEKHEVLSTQPGPTDLPTNAILEVVEPGYTYKGLLLRPARIIVAE
jgi:molecular chaperone GrpE